jgi:hypothetical protein
MAEFPAFRFFPPAVLTAIGTTATGIAFRAGFTIPPDRLVARLYSAEGLQMIAGIAWCEIARSHNMGCDGGCDAL